MLKGIFDAVQRMVRLGHAQTGITPGLTNPPAFFEGMRSLRGKLTSRQVEGANAILAACNGWPVSWTAYALATAWHETAYTLQPIREHGGPAYFKRMYDIEGNRPEVARRLGNNQPGDGALFCGRGYVQLTGRDNYRKAGSKLGFNLTLDPDAALEPSIAASIMRVGMEEGWFTGKSLRTFLPRGVAAHNEYVKARRIINGTDRAAKIADHAVAFQRALIAGGYRA